MRTYVRVLDGVVPSTRLRGLALTAIALFTHLASADIDWHGKFDSPAEEPRHRWLLDLGQLAGADRDAGEHQHYMAVGATAILAEYLANDGEALRKGDERLVAEIRRLVSVRNTTVVSPLAIRQCRRHCIGQPPDGNFF